jgi:hypothetical protein
MNGFLVVGRCSSDDVPLWLCSTLDEAQAFARAVSAADVRAADEAVYGCWPSSVECVHVVEFRDGRPGRVQSVPGADVEDDSPPVRVEVDPDSLTEWDGITFYARARVEG